MVGAEERQRVHLPGARIDDVGIVVFPPDLVLLRTAMVIDGEQHAPGPLGSITQPHRRTPAVRTDLEKWCIGNGRRRRDGRVPERVPFVGGHEPLRSQRLPATRLGELRSGHQVSQWMIVSGSGRIAGSKSVPCV